MPQNVHASPGPSRRRWGVIIAFCSVAAGFLLVNRSCVKERAAPIASQVAPGAAGALANPAAANANNNAPIATGATTGPQMRAMVFELDASGIHLSQSAIAEGRAKAPPISNAPRRLEFEVYGPDGAVSYAGAFDHPLWQQTESVDEKGALAATGHQLAQSSCLVRIPADVPATRIEFFDVDATSGVPGRRSIGSFAVR